MDVVIPKTGIIDASDVIYLCGEPNQYQLTFDGGNYRFGSSFWVNIEGDLIVPNNSVTYGTYTDPTKFIDKALAIYPLNAFGVPDIQRGLRVDFNEYKFRLIQLAFPEHNEKEIIFRHYPSLPTNLTINDYVTTTSLDTLEACIEDGIASFSLPVDKVDASMDGRIRWEFVTGNLGNETLASVFSPQDVRNVNYSIINIPNTQAFVNNEHIYVLSMQLERPVPQDAFSIGNHCVQTTTKTIALKVFRVANEPAFVTGDTVWYCDRNPYTVPIQIDRNYYPQFTPQWTFFKSSSDPGFAGDPNLPYIENSQEPGTYLQGVTRDFNVIGNFSTYYLSVRLFNVKCVSPSRNLVVKVGTKADTAKFYQDTAYLCGTASLSGVEFKNVGVTPGTIGSVSFSKISGPNTFSFSTTGNNPGVLRIDNLEVPNVGSINNYLFQLTVQNGNCPIDIYQRDTLLVTVISDIPRPLVYGTDNNDNVDVYLASNQDLVPLSLEDNGIFDYTWTLNDPNITFMSSSQPYRYLFKGFTPVSGATTIYDLIVESTYGNNSCKSDLTTVHVRVNRGYPLTIDRVITDEETIVNEEFLDTITVCTNGTSLTLKPRQGSPLSLQVRTISPLGQFTNFTYTKQTNSATSSDTSITVTFDALIQGQEYLVLFDLVLFDGGIEVTSKEFVVRMSGSVIDDPILPDVSNVYLCAQSLTTLGVSSSDPGTWKQVGGNAVVIDDITNPNTEITQLIRPSREQDFINYMFEWTVPNGFCPSIVDTQRIVNLPLLSTPYIFSLSQLDAGGNVIRTTNSFADTLCISTPTTSANVRYRIISNDIVIGQSEWIFDNQKSINVSNVPTITNAISDTLDIQLDYPAASQDVDSIVYVFERRVYHSNLPVGCDTNRVYAYVIMDKNTRKPELLGGESLLQFCADDNMMSLSAKPVGRTVHWRIVPEFLKKTNAAGLPEVVGDVREISPNSAEGFDVTFIGFFYSATQNIQSKLSTTANDSFSLFVEMQSVGDYCYLLKDTIETRIYNKPSVARFIEEDPIYICGTDNFVTDSNNIVQALQNAAVTPIIGNQHYTRIFSGASFKTNQVDSQVWQYSVYHGSCDTTSAFKTVFLQNNTFVDVAKVTQDTFFVCYNNSGINDATTVSVLAETPTKASIGSWNLISSFNEKPLFSDITDPMFTMGGTAIANNLQVSNNNQVIYELEWELIDACGNNSKDTALVVHYGAPSVSLQRTNPDLSLCTFDNLTNQPLFISGVSGGSLIWYLDTLTLESIVDGFRSGSRVDYVQADTIPSGRQITVANHTITYFKPTFTNNGNDTTRLMTVGADFDVLATYQFTQKIQNGEKCPLINVSDVTIETNRVRTPQFNYTGYTAGNAGTLINCAPVGNSTMPVNIAGLSSNAVSKLSFVAEERANPGRYSTISDPNFIQSLTCGSTLASCSESPTFDFSSVGVQYDISQITANLVTSSRVLPSAQCGSSQSIKINILPTTAAYNTLTSSGLGYIKDTAMRVCKGNNVNTFIEVNNPTATKYVLERRIYNRTAAFWEDWERVDSSVSQVEFRGFTIAQTIEDSLQYRVEGRFETLSSLSCAGFTRTPIILPGLVTISSINPYTMPSQTVGDVTVNGITATSILTCFNDKEEIELGVNNYEGVTIPNSSPVAQTQNFVVKWQQGYGSPSLGELVWADLNNSSLQTSIVVNYLQELSYYRAVFETNTGCYAYSDEIRVDFFKGTATSRCLNPYIRPGLAPGDSGPNIYRYQFFEGQPNNIVAGFNYNVPFTWTISQPVSQSATGIPVSGNGINRVIFDALPNNTNDIFTDTVTFTRVLDGSDPSDNTLRPQDVITTYIDVIPLVRLNPNLNGISYSKTVIAGSDVSINELNPLVEYKWQMASSGSTPVTGITANGTGKGTLTFTTVVSDVTLRDTLVFIKQGQDVLYNNFRDTVIVYITAQPIVRLAINEQTREVTLVAKSRQQNLLINRFISNTNFSWETASAIRSGVSTGNSVTGISNSGTGMNSITFNAVLNPSNSTLRDTIYFVTGSTPAGYVFSRLDTVIYYVEILPETHLRDTTGNIITKTIYVQDSVDVGAYINGSVGFGWQLLSTTSATVNYKTDPFLLSSRQNGSTGSGMNNFRYYAPSTVPNLSTIEDTILFYRNDPAVISTNDGFDTLYFVVRVLDAPHLNTKVGLTKIDTVQLDIFNTTTLFVSTPVLTSGIPYTWTNTSGLASGSNVSKIGLPASGTSSAGTAFTNTAVQIQGTTAVTDTITLIRIGNFQLFNNFRDTVVLIVSVKPLPKLVNTANTNVAFNRNGYYTSDIRFPYSDGLQSVDYFDLINANVSYTFSRVSINALGNVFYKAASSTNYRINAIAHPSSTVSENQLTVYAAKNTTSSVLLDTILLVKANTSTRTSEDSLILFLSNQPKTFLRRSVVPQYLVINKDYSQESINIGAQYLNSSVPFFFRRVSNFATVNTLSSSTLAALESTLTFSNNIIFDVQINSSSMVRTDTFHLVSVAGAVKSSLDTLSVVINQQPNIRLRKEGLAKYVYKDYYGSAFPFTIRDEIYQGVSFVPDIRGVSTTTTTGLTTIDSLVVTPGFRLTGFDTLVIYRNSDLTSILNDQDSLYVVLRYYPEQRLRNNGFNAVKRIFIPIQNIARDIIIDNEINRHVPYLVTFSNTSPNQRAVDSFSIDGGLTFSSISNTGITYQDSGILRLRTFTNRTGQTLFDSIVLTRSINTASNNSQDTLTLIVELPPLDCVPVLQGVNSTSTANQIRMIDLNDGQIATLGYNMFSAVPKAWQINPSSGATSRASDLSTVLGSTVTNTNFTELPLVTASNTLTPAQFLIDTLVVYPDYFNIPYPTSLCSSDTAIFYIRVYPMPCNNGITGGRATQEIIRLKQDTDSFFTYSLGGSPLQIDYIYTEQNPTFQPLGSATNLARTSAGPTDRISYHSFLNNLPYSLFDTLQIFRTSPTSMLCPNSSLASDTIEVILELPPSDRLRSTRSSKYISFEVDEGEPIRIKAGIHINTGVPYRWTTSGGTSLIGTSGGIGSGINDFNFTATAPTDTSLIDTILLVRDFQPNPNAVINFGNFDSLWVYVKVNPLVRLSSSTTNQIDTIFRSVDFMAQRVNIGRPDITLNLPYTWTQSAYGGLNAPNVAVVNDLKTQDNFIIDVQANSDSETKATMFILSVDRIGGATYKNTLVVVLIQLRKQDYLRRDNTPKIQSLYVDGSDATPINIKNQINQGVNFDYIIRGGNFLNKISGLTGSTIDSLVLQNNAMDVTSQLVDTVILVNSTLSTFNPSNDSFILVVHKTPIVRLRTPGYARYQYAPQSTLWNLDDPINDQVEFIYNLQTNNGIINRGIVGSPIGPLVDTIQLPSNISYSTATVSDTALLVRDGPFLNGDDTITLVVSKSPFARLRKSATPQIIRFDVDGSTSFSMNELYINTFVGYRYNITDNNAIDFRFTTQNVASSANAFTITFNDNFTSSSIVDTVTMIRNDSDPANINEFDTLIAIFNLNPFKRLRQPSTPAVLFIEETLDISTRIVISHEINAGVNFTNLADFPVRIYRDSIEFIRDPNLTSIDIVTSDTFVRRTNNADLLNSLDTLVINLRLKPLKRLRRNGIPQTITIPLSSLGSFVVGGQYLNQNIVFDWTYTATGIAIPAVTSNPGQDSIKIYSRRNISSSDVLDVLQLYRVGPAANNNSQDTLTINFQIDKIQGLHLSNMLSTSFQIRTAEYIRFDEFFPNKYYTYNTNVYGGIDMDRVIDSNYQSIPANAVSSDLYVAKADTGLSFAIYDTITFLSTDALGNPIVNADIPTSIDSFFMYITLIPANLTNGQRNAREVYQSVSFPQSYKKYLNEDIEFDWQILNNNPQTGLDPTGEGQDSLLFTPNLNISNKPYIDTVRFVKTLGRVKSYRDTLITEIVVNPIPRPWKDGEVTYTFYSGRNVVLDSFNKNVPFTWTTAGRTGLSTQGSGVNNVYFKTTINNTTATIVDTVIFVKQVDGQLQGFWDTLTVYINVRPQTALYEVVNYPNQYAYLEVCSGSEVFFTDFIAGVSYRFDNTFPLGVTNTNQDTLKFIAPINTSRTVDRLDTLTVVRDPLIDADDKVLRWDSLIIYVRTIKQPPVVPVSRINTAVICPNSVFDSNQIAISSSGNVFAGTNADKRYELLWYQDSSLIGKGVNLPYIRIGVYDSINIMLVTNSTICSNSINDTMNYLFKSYDLPRLNIRWKGDSEEDLSYPLSDTLKVCGLGIIDIENKTIDSRSGNTLTYNWSSPSIMQINNNRSPEFSFDAPALVGISGQNRPSEFHDVHLTVTSQCYDSTINTILQVNRVPELRFDFPDTICLPNVVYPINNSIAYDPIVLNWSVDGSSTSIHSNQSIIDFSEYIADDELEHTFMVTASAETLCGRKLSVSNPIHVFNRLKPTIDFNASFSLDDTICISSKNDVYFTSALFLPPALIDQDRAKAYNWFINDSLVGKEQDLITSLTKIDHFIDYATDSIRFTVGVDHYNCYGDTIVPVQIIRGVQRPSNGDDPLEFFYHNYCPPALVSFQSNMENVTAWKWYDEGSLIYTLKLSENVKESTRNNILITDALVPADTSFLNNFIYRGAGTKTMNVVVNNDFALCPSDSISISLDVFNHPKIKPPNLVIPPSFGGVLCFPADVTFETFPDYPLDNPLEKYFWALNDEEFVESTGPEYQRFITRADVPVNSDLAINEYVLDVLGCQSLIVPALIREQAKPVADFIYRDICLGDTFYTTSKQFNYDPINNNRFLRWDMGDGTTYQDIDQIKHYYDAEGIYTIRLIVGYTNLNCVADTLESTITVYGPIDVEVEFPEVICLNTAIDFKVVEDNSFDTIQNYLWTFNDDPVLTAYEKDPTRSFSTAGVYMVKLVATSRHCNIRDIVVRDIIVSAPIRAGITYDNIYTSKNNPVGLFAEPGGIDYTWNHQLLLDNPIINNPMATVDVDTKFEVRINFNGCYVTDYQKIIITDNIFVSAPAAFTPNGDGINDIFKPTYIGITSLNFFKVYDAAGKEVFSTNNPNQGWEGLYQGEKLPTAVYKWVVSAQDRENNNQFSSGALLLVE